MKKENRSKLKNITRKYYRSSRQRNIFVIFAIIMAAFLLITVYSIGLNFYYGTREQQTLSEGTSRDIIVTDPTEKQIRIAEGLRQCKYVGLEARCGIVQKCNDKIVTYRLLWKDIINWEKQTSQGIENIVGNYPQNEDDIMMSEWLLKELGFQEYELGMEIPITYSVEKEQFEKIFHLSGYYTDHVALLNPGSEALLVSENFYDSARNIMTTSSREMGITLKSKLISEEQIQNIEDQLQLEENQGYYYNEELINIAKLLVIAIIVVSLLIMFCAYLLIYNILYISFSKDVQTYGLLKTLGMTKRQMRFLLLKQVLFMAAVGIFAGEILGGIIAVSVIPTVMGKMFSDENLFVQNNIRVEVFVFAAIFVLITVLVSCQKPIKTVIKISPLSAIKYEGITIKKKTKRGKKGAKPYRMAIYNVSCNKRKAIIVYLSLFLGLVLFMSINTYTNSINKQDYVNAYMPVDAILQNPTRNDSGNLGDQIFDDQILSQLEEIEGVDQCQIVTSDTINVGFSEEMFGEYLKEFCALWMNDSYENVLERIKEEPLDFYGCLIGISNEQLEDLELSDTINISDFEAGRTCILQTDIPIEGSLNQEVNFNLVGSENKYNLKIAGVAEKNLSSYSGIAPNIYVSNKVLHNFISNPWIEKISISYEKSYDAETEKKLEILIQDTGAEMTSRIKMYENIGSFKDQLNVLGNGLAGIIAIIGLLNFVNVIITNICERKQEFVILNYIGMTQKQIKQMLVYEGLVYGLGTVILVSTIGSIISFTIFSIAKEPYMILHFPYIPVIAVLGGLIVICIVLPVIVSRRILDSK